MGTTLTPDNLPARKPSSYPPGHDVKSLGPSDSSDSGSDMAGPGLIDSDAIGLDRGSNEDVEAGRDDIADAGASVGDLGMDGDSDRFGTGEHLAAGQEPSTDVGGDIDA